MKVMTIFDFHLYINPKLKFIIIQYLKMHYYKIYLNEN